MRGVRTMKGEWQGKDQSELRDGRTSERGRYHEGQMEIWTSLS